MPRQARTKVPGFPLHVFQRGHNKSSCFTEPGDHTLYLALLAESSQSYGCAVHAYVLMTNHVHLLVSPPDPEGISRVMKRLNERYAMHFNRRDGRTGGVWEGRFKTCLVDSDAYLLCVQRYIELNPIRAAMVAHPGDYPWSSYRSNAYGERSELLSPHSLYLEMGSTEDERQLRYRRFLSEGTPDAELKAIRGATRAGAPLASSQVLEQLPEECRRTPNPPGRPRKVRSAQEPIPLYGKPGLSRFQAGTPSFQGSSTS
jgi:putative transposase